MTFAAIVFATVFTIFGPDRYTFRPSRGYTSLSIEHQPYTNGEFIFSRAPGIFSSEFTLNISVPNHPTAVIYWTIDGGDPVPGNSRTLSRRRNTIEVSGVVPANGNMEIIDRSGHWRDSILTYHSNNWPNRGVTPSFNAHTLRGTALRLRAFVDDQPVTDIVTATYIIAPDVANRFTELPIISLTANYSDFIRVYTYNHPVNVPEDPYRRTLFNVEYFEMGEYQYERQFNVVAGGWLGGAYSRGYAQRTLNMSVIRHQMGLDPSTRITHPIFDGVSELARFRLWNGGNSFATDHLRDPFVHEVSQDLNLLHSRYQLMMKFINGEFWGFTTMREHTSNAHFVNYHTGIEHGNMLLMDGNWTYRGHRRFERNEGSNAQARRYFGEDRPGNPEQPTSLYYFLLNYDVATDAGRERLFNEFFCEANFIDTIFVRSFFDDWDFLLNNTRIFRAIDPNVGNPNNPYNDGLWRIILHDTDHSGNVFRPWPHSDPRSMRLFPRMYNREHGSNPIFMNVWRVLNNPTFAENFRARSLYIMENHFDAETLTNVHQKLVEERRPVLRDMYNRFPTQGNIRRTMWNFNRNVRGLDLFINNRHEHFSLALDYIVERTAPNSTATWNYNLPNRFWRWWLSGSLTGGAIVIVGTWFGVKAIVKRKKGGKISA